MDLAVTRDSVIFEFMEPVDLDVTLTNISEEPMLIDEHALSSGNHVTVIIAKKGRPARQWQPYAARCWRTRKIVLEPGSSQTESLFIAAGLNGWELAEPGDYKLQVATHLNGEDVVSSVLKVRILPPRGYEEEVLAQDFFSDDVGRALAFDGSSSMTDANAVLREASERFPDRRVAIHARVALGAALAREHKLLDLSGADKEICSESAAGAKIYTVPVEIQEAKEQLSVLKAEATVAKDTLGSGGYNYYETTFKKLLD